MSNKPETKTFYLTRDVNSDPDHIFLWDDKPKCDSQGNYFIEELDDDQLIPLMRGCSTMREWERSFQVRFKKGTQIKVTLEISEAETAVDRAKSAIESNVTKADLIAILKDLIDGEPENSRDDEDDYDDGY